MGIRKPVIFSGICITGTTSKKSLANSVAGTCIVVIFKPLLPLKNAAGQLFTLKEWSLQQTKNVMRMFNFFTSASVCYLLLRLLLLVVTLFTVPVPEIFYSVANDVSFFLFLLVYLSLGFIFRHYKEKNWYSILIYLYLAFSVLIYLFVKAGINPRFVMIASTVNFAVLITFLIGCFFLRSKEISVWCKFLALGMVADMAIKMSTPLLNESYHLPKLIFVLGIVSLFPAAIIFLLNKKLTPQAVYDQGAFNIE